MRKEASMGSRLKMERGVGVVGSSVSLSVLTRATWCNIPEDGILHSHCCENLKSYISINTIYREEEFKETLETSPLW
jgi:hypothetical protein